MKPLFQILILQWLPTYEKSFVKDDITAGIVVGILLIPQGMAYALLAGLPPQYGMYAAIVPQLVYAFLGTSPVLAVGPVATDSLLVALGLAALNITETHQYIAAAVLLSLLIGLLQLLLGILKLGVLVNFLSKPVINGFTAAVALVIFVSQMPSFMGITIANKASFVEKMKALVVSFPFLDSPTIMVGVSSLCLLVFFKLWIPKVPAAIVLVVVFTGLSFAFDFEALGILTIGPIPSGLPSFSLPHLDRSLWKELLPMASTLALVSFTEAIAIAKSFEERQNNYQVHPNRELIAIGWANTLGAFFSAYPTTGGFSRTAVNQKAGAKTNLSAFVSAAIVLISLLYLTDVFSFLPKASLAALVIVSVTNLVDFSFPKQLFATRKDEFSILILTFITTLLVGIKEGIITGMLLSMLAMIYRTSQPHIAVLGKVSGSDYYKNIRRFAADTTERADLLILRFDGQLYFGNKDYFKKQLTVLADQKQTTLKGIVLNAEAITHIDSTACAMLFNLIENFHKKNVSFYISGAIGPTRDILYANGIARLLGENKLFIRTAEAVCYYDNKCSPSNIQKKVVAQSEL